jgi:phosphoenolpyruvate-protein kinase (PTS system EI component)
MLPSVASINGMQVKDYIQALVDDGKLHVERIGSGNWYWTWCGEERKERKKIRDGLAKEADKIQRAVETLQEKLNVIRREMEKEDGAEEQELERAELLVRKSTLERELVRLKRQKEELANGGMDGGVEKKEADIKRGKVEAEAWTDNIYILEGYLAKLAGGDREIVDAIKRECYGDEYVEGEGLRELET